MWDPLLNEFPESVHGFRCMVAIKYLQSVQETYEPNTLGHDLIRDLISVVRARAYVQATRRYNYFHARLGGSPKAELRQPIQQPGCCPHCPRHKQATIMHVRAHVPEAQNIQNVSKA
uniref:Protein V2 n=1 Tax=Tomato yellow leaf curl virus TaxID=10832 RepID=A0A1B0YHZ9_9GEMI|nr:movement protein [Tomato yellow leaf curl virus]